MPLDIRLRFGRAIRRIREEQGINQEEAAERCGLHRTYYSGVERGVPIVASEYRQGRQWIEENAI
jgi:transcriptional regulator with XRE-family HTH domain